MALLSLLDYLLDAFTIKGGLITQYNSSNTPVHTSFQSFLFPLVLCVFTVLMTVLLLHDHEITVASHSFTITQIFKFLPLLKTRIARDTVKQIQLEYKKTSNGEYAYLRIETINGQKKTQLLSSETS